MVIGITLLIIAALIASIWMFWEFKRFKHKLFAIFLIGLVLFLYVSMAVTFRGKNIDFASFSGVKDASALYLSFLGSLFGNLKTITANVIQMDWGVSGNSSSGK